MIENKFIRKVLCKLLFGNIADTPTTAYSEIVKYISDDTMKECYIDGMRQLLDELLSGD